MRRPLSRVGLAILFSALLVVGAALPAAADGPVYRELTWGEDGWSVTVTDVCGFPFQITYDAGNVTQTLWVRSDGSQVWRLTGVARNAVYANLDTGYAVSLNEAGAITVTTYPDGSVYILFAGTHGPPMAAPNWVLTGAQKVYISPEGIVTWTFHGNAEEVCAMLNH